MNYFRYKLLNSTGNVVSGIVGLPFDDLLSAISYLEGNENTTISVRKMGVISSFVFRSLKRITRRKVKRKLLAEWFNNLSMMVKAGMPLVTALEESAGSLDHRDFKNDIKDMILSIKRGSGFSGAMDRHGHIFPKTVCYLARIGEESGTLDERLKDAADHLKRIQTIIDDTRQALMYPSFVFAAMGTGMVFWFYYVVPKIVALFNDMDVQLPPLTLFLVAISEFVQRFFMEITGSGILLFFLSAPLYQSLAPVKKSMDMILFKVPIISTLVQASTLAFITEYFSLLLNAGIDLRQSIKILEESIGNEVYRKKLGEIKNNLATGISISDAFTRARIFPAFICRMISIGEMSGTLPGQLDFIANDYKQKLNTLVAGLGKIIEPLVLVIAGLMFAIIIAGLFLPIYDLVGNLGALQ